MAHALGPFLYPRSHSTRQPLRGSLSTIGINGITGTDRKQWIGERIDIQDSRFARGSASGQESIQFQER